MRQLCVTLSTFLLAFSLSDSYAETYTWTDKQGTVHFTEDLGQVPKNIRKTVRKSEDIEPPPVEDQTSPAPARSTTDKDAKDAAQQAAPVDKARNPEPAEIYAGKTYTQWEKDLRDREAAMTVIRNRLVEIVDLTSKPTRGDEREKLLAEHTTLLAQFQDLKAQYYQQVEIARKAGLKINIQSNKDVKDK
jgi:Domain of unknown function (DUF4124)